jgi:hypothetical protein
MKPIAALLLLCVAAPAWADRETMTKAKAYFDAGVDAYDQGKYDVALRDFEQAHNLSHSAALYFNMAACEEHLVGAAALGVGAYTVVHHGDLKSGCGATAGGCSSAQISGLKSTAVATDVLIGVTAAAAVATVILAVVETRHHKEHAAATTATRVAFVGNGVRF